MPAEPRPGEKAWTPEDIDKLRFLAKRKRSPFWIAFRLGRSVSSVKMKAEEEDILLNSSEHGGYG